MRRDQHVIGLMLVILVVMGAASALSAGDPRPLTAIWREMFARPSEAGPIPPYLRQRHALGELLFHDPRLSGDGTRTCAGCHQVTFGLTDGRRRAKARPGVNVVLPNTPTLYNLAGNARFNWDGSATSIETQVLGPLQSPAEMAADLPTVIERLRKDKTLVGKFQKAFPQETTISTSTITKALASYVRSLTAPRTRFDAWIEGQPHALGRLEKQGFRLFVGEAGCVGCHVGWRLTDGAFHDIGLKDENVADIATASGKIGVRAFKTPTLRAIKKTAPYMHNGSLATLDDVIQHYLDGVVERKGLSGLLNRDLSLTAQDKAALVAFLKTL